jgi:hypothetical protein
MEYDVAFEYFMNNIMNLQKSIIPLFGVSRPGERPRFIGSSIYCKTGQAHYLLSAGHVIKQGSPYKLWYPYEQGLMVELPSDVYAFPNKEERDFCIAPFKGPLPNWIPLDSSTFASYESGDEYQHILAGYPGSYVKESHDDNIELTVMGYLTSSAKREALAKIKIDESNQIALQFWKKNVYGKGMKKVTFPDPNGMSGGAVFQFNESRPQVQSLVGIMTDWIAQSAKVIVATRIETIINSFRILEMAKAESCES